MKKFAIKTRYDLSVFVQKAIDFAVLENRKQYIHKSDDGLYYFTNGRDLPTLPEMGHVFPGGMKVLLDKHLVDLL